MKSLDSRLAWLGGVIDGEGHISISLHTRKNVPRKDGTPGTALVFDVGVTNTDFSLIAEVQDIAQLLGIKYHCYLIERGTRKDKPCWTLRFCGARRVKAVLTAVLSHLVAKQHRAEMALKIIEHRWATMNPSGGLGPRTHPETDAWLMSALGDLKHLNRRGPAPVEERI